MHRTFWHRRMWMSRCDTTYVQKGVVRTRGNCLDGAVALAERLAIMRELVK